MDTPSAALPPMFHPDRKHSVSAMLSPPESRRTSGEEKEASRGPVCQSLPSIHEALAAEQSYSTAPSSTPVAAAQSFPPPPPISSHSSQGPPSLFGRPSCLEPSTASPSTTALPPVRSDPLPWPSGVDSRSSFPEPRAPFSGPISQSSSSSTLQRHHSVQSPPPAAASRPAYPYQLPPTTSYEPSTPRSIASTHQSYNYPPHTSAHSASTPTASNSHPAYPTSAPSYSTSRHSPPPSWQSDAASEVARLEEKKIGRPNLAPYGESVKRHLESFDLEASLNEMAEGAGRITDFSKIYRQRAHESQRIGMGLHSMPRLEEVDDMLKHNERIHMSLNRMREVVYNHHQASLAEPPQDPRYRQHNGYDNDSSSAYGDDVKGSGGFAGPAPKTRRGRAAPPGRCHSCNRAETPEWRRGPDGARTLCNACGLHYAKLTRKMGGKPAMASSNLRPKSLEQGPISS